MKDSYELNDLNERDISELTGSEKTALFLYLIGPDKANAVLKNFDLKDQKTIRRVLTQLAPVRTKLGVAVLSQFLSDVEQVVVSESPQDFGKSLSETRSIVNSLLDEGMIADNVKGLEDLKSQTPDTIYNIIESSHPQIVSTVLAYLDDFKAAAVLEHFSEERRTEYIENISRMDSIRPMALKDLASIIDKLNQSDDGSGGAMPIGGTKSAANILNFLTPGNDEKVLSGISEFDQSLAEEIRDKMFVFADMISIEALDLQKIIATIDLDVLSIALKGQHEDLIKKFSMSMSQRQSTRFLEDLAERPSVKLSEVNDAQKTILAVVRRMHDTGDIVIPGKNEDYV